VGVKFQQILPLVLQESCNFLEEIGIFILFARYLPHVHSYRIVIGSMSWYFFSRCDELNVNTSFANQSEKKTSEYVIGITLRSIFNSIVWVNADSN
jgi:hypothetical protein